MEYAIGVTSDQRNGNLHVKLAGVFDDKQAFEVGHHIQDVYRGKGNIFIHTNDLTEIAPSSKMMFKHMLGVLELPKEHIYLMGEKGRDICHEEGKVIVHKKKSHGHCCGRCKNCSCGKKKTETHYQDA